MTAIIVLITFSLLLAGGFLISFLLSVKSGQFDDTYTPAIRMLFDDELKKDADGESKSRGHDEIKGSQAGNAVTDREILQARNLKS